jgi:hypothetical protein
MRSFAAVLLVSAIMLAPTVTVTPLRDEPILRRVIRVIKKLVSTPNDAEMSVPKP